MTIILYEETNATDTHEPRAQALSAIIEAANKVEDIRIKPYFHFGLHTLIYWGHGIPGIFCGLSPKDFAKNMKSWKAFNADLKTFELISCNLGHTNDKAASYFEALKKELKKIKELKSCIVKTLPTQSEAYKGASILIWEATTKTWAYITGATEKDMFAGRALFQYEVYADGDKFKVRDRPGYTNNSLNLVEDTKNIWRNAVSKTVPAGVYMPKDSKDKILNLKITIRAGRLQDLRNFLVVVKKEGET